MDDTITLYRPVGTKELELIERSGFRAFPPRLPEQPIFYPVLTEAYAARIARDWNVGASGAGCATPADRCARNTGFRRRIWRHSTPASSTGSRSSPRIARRRTREMDLIVE